MALLLYRIFFPVAFVLVAPFYILRLWRREKGRSTQVKPPGYHVGIAQRFGRIPAGLLPSGERPYWICSISVGETLMALKLARALRARSPRAPVVLSVTTSTGYELLLRECARLPWITPIYNPIDFTLAVRSTLRNIRPRALVLVEGGIWPNLLRAARQEGIPVALTSARLSPRSERRWKRWPHMARAVWQLFDLVCVPEQGDLARFQAIGVNPTQLVHTGNLKFDNAAPETVSREAEFRTLVKALGFESHILVAGSTWAPEESMLSSALRTLRRDHPALKLIIVPRHVERSDEVAACFEGFQLVRRSHLPKTDPADVLLVDTTGELRDWYRLATVVFVGKSMPGVAEVGGQNAGEPAAFGLPVLFGPHMENFPNLVDHLLRQEAAVKVGSEKELVRQVDRLLRQPSARTAIGERARAALLPHQGAAERTATAVEHLMTSFSRS